MKSTNDFLFLSSFNLTLPEKRMIALSFSKLIDLNSYRDDEVGLIFRIDEYRELTGILEKRAYPTVRKLIKSIRSTKAPLTLFEKIFITPEEVEYWFSPIVLASTPEIIEKYTKDYVKTVSKLSSKHTWGLYDIIQSMKIWRKNFTMERIKELFGVESIHSYSSYKGINYHIFKPAIKELKELGIVEVSVAPVKSGRRVTEVRIEKKRINKLQKIIGELNET